MKENKLLIFTENQQIGELIFSPDEDKFTLTYTTEWKKAGHPLSPHLLLDQGSSSVSVRRYLENQFPEGRGLEILLDEFRIGRNNIFRIIQILGNETTGALHFVDPENNQTQQTTFREISEQELIERLNQRGKLGLVVWDGKPRLSVAGVQDKLPITILNDGRMGFGEGTIASTHILKFQKNDSKLPFLVLNEFFCMRIAKAVGLRVADVEYKKLGPHPVLFVKRFDRKLINDNQVYRYHMIDGCQALDLPSTYKYERNFGGGRDVAHIRDGASLKKLFGFCHRCATPAKAILETMNWVIFNLCISNADSHGKNISYFIDHSGINLTPAYDLLNISMYPDVEQELAMSIGDEFRREKIFALQLKEFCEECNIPKKLFLDQFKKLAKKIIENLDTLKLDLMGLTQEESDFLQRMKKNIKEQTQHFLICANEVLKLRD